MLSDEGRALSVLVVDDDSDLLRTLSDILRLHGCDAETASTGREGLVLARQRVPAVALVDLRLPDMDGLELVAKLKTASQSTEVIILTGNASIDSAVRAMRQQSFDYLIKPVRPDDLFRTLDRAGQRFYRHQAEAALRASEERMRRVFSAVHDGLLIVDEDDRIVQANAAAARIAGIAPDELLGMRIVALLGPEMASGALARSGEATRREVRLAPALGEARHVDVVATSFAADRSVYAIRDVTEQRDMQERLRVAQKMEALGRLAGGVAHDFNNVLTAIRGYADMVHGALGEGQLADDVNEIRRASDRASALTRQLLSFSRRQVLQPIPLDLGETLTELEGMLSRLVRADFALSIRAEPSPVVADPSQLEQIFLNLVVNARDAMPDGGEIVIETGSMTGEEAPPPAGEADRSGEAYSFVRVSDSGVGIPEDVLPHIFEPFFTTKEAGKGTGFGLSTIHGIVHQMGGRVHVESEPGATAFTVLLPRRDGAADFPARAAGAQASRSDRGTESILLVEDDAAISRMMERYLATCGYTVHVSATGAEALEVLESERSVDLVVTDIVLSDITGWDVARLAVETRPDIRVLYMSGYAEDDVEGTVIAPGIAFIPKPFTARELAARIRGILDGEEPGRPH